MITLIRAATLVGGLSILATPGCSPTYTMALSGEPGGVLLAGWSDGDELLAVGGQLDKSSGLLVRQLADGSWCKEEAFADRTVWWIHGDGAGSWFAVGANGLILHQTPDGLVDESIDTEATLYGVWDAGDRVWAVGGDPFETRLGEIWVREEGTWSLVQSEIPGTLFKVWDEWIVGDGNILRFVDGTWIDATPEAEPRLLTVRGRGPDDVWAVGGQFSAEVWHWDGSTWGEVEVSPYCASQPLNGVWTAPGEDVWVAGMSAGAGRYDGSEWHCPEVPITTEHFHAAWPQGDEMYFLGGDLFRPSDNTSYIGRYGSSRQPISMTSCR